jgi:hypothetical protein
MRPLLLVALLAGSGIAGLFPGSPTNACD